MGIDLNPATMIEGGSRPDQGQVVHPWTFGMFTRSADAHGLPAQGDIWAYKLSLMPRTCDASGK